MNRAAPSTPRALPASPLQGGSASEPSTQTTSSPLPSATKRQTPTKDAVAGACAGAIAKTAVAPIERIKLLMQLQFSIDNRSETKKSGAAPSPAGHASSRGGQYSAWEVTKLVYRDQVRDNMDNRIDPNTSM